MVGNAIDKALQLFFGLAVEERSEEVLHQALRSVWPQHVTEGAFFDKDEEIDGGREALALLSKLENAVSPAPARGSQTPRPFSNGPGRLAR